MLNLKTRAILATTLLCGLSAGQEGSGTIPPRLFTCTTISRARPGYGVAYRGTVKNSDYGFDVTVPRGLTGWGAGKSAPFHGFIVYLEGDASAPSCINFEIGVHVDLPEDANPAQPGPTREGRVRVGNNSGTVAVRTGVIGGTMFKNVAVVLEHAHGTEKADLSITLVTPTENERRALPVFDRFLSEFRFW